MADSISVVETFHAEVGDSTGEGTRLLQHVSERGVNLNVFAASACGEGRTLLSFCTDRKERLQEAARDADIKLEGPRQAYLIIGEDRVGALHQHHLTLAMAGVRIESSCCVSDDKGRFGFVVWVDPRDQAKATGAFGFD